MPRVVPSDVVAVIDRMFPKLAGNRQDAPNITFDNLPELVAVARLVESISEELLTLSPNHYALLIASTAYLRALPDALQAAGSNQLGPGWTNTLSLRPRGFDENVISLIRAAMVACPDEAPSPATVPLAFIVDSALRESIRLDMSAANQALSNGGWKGATVLAGSAVEALLLWALQEHDRQYSGTVRAAVTAMLGGKPLTRDPGADLEGQGWHLHEYVEVAGRLGIIESDTATQVRLAKEFRNFIHPGRVVRLGQKCDRGTALSALAAVELVVRDLTP